MLNVGENFIKNSVIFSSILSYAIWVSLTENSDEVIKIVIGDGNSNTCNGIFYCLINEISNDHPGLIWKIVNIYREYIPTNVSIIMRLL
jgi:hypothetical protein